MASLECFMPRLWPKTFRLFLFEYVEDIWTHNSYLLKSSSFKDFKKKTDFISNPYILYRFKMLSSSHVTGTRPSPTVPRLRDLVVCHQFAVLQRTEKKKENEGKENPDGKSMPCGCCSLSGFDNYAFSLCSRFAWRILSSRLSQVRHSQVSAGFPHLHCGSLSLVCLI